MGSLNNQIILNYIDNDSETYTYRSIHALTGTSVSSYKLINFESRHLNRRVVLDKDGYLYVVNNPYVFTEDTIVVHQEIQYYAEVFEIGTDVYCLILTPV